MSKNNNKNKSSFAKKTVKVMAVIALVAVSITALSAAAFAIYVNTPAEIDESKLVNLRSVPVVYDKNGDLSQYSKDGFSYVGISEIPDSVKDAFVALEDKRFYSHNGIDYKRIAGAFVANIKKGGMAQGGSTITQQVAKNAFLSREKSLERKLKEARYAVSLEKKYDKEKILEIYLNMLYFGSGEYGVKDAAKRFFCKNLNELTVAECAMLAGIVKSPVKYNPINNYDNSVARTQLVLRLMFEQGKINENSYNMAKNENIIINNAVKENTFDKIYVANALEEACDILGIDEKTFKAQGYSLYTYLDNARQKELKNIVSNEAYYVKSNDKILCASLDIDNASGSVSAIYANFPLSVFDMKRQAGSTLKPLACYAPAFDAGLLSPASVITDEQTDFYGYSPKNYKDIYYGNVSVRECLAKSLNVPAVKALTTIGVQQGYDTLKSLGFDLSEDDDNLSLALGSTKYGNTLLQIAGGYCALARYGSYVSPTFVKEIKDCDGNTVYIDNRTSSRVFTEQTSYLTTDILMTCAKEGTAKKLKDTPFSVASKTGTVACNGGNSDAYNVSYTSENTVLFWQGSENPSSPMPDSVTGGGTPTLMCSQYLKGIYIDRYPQNFYVPQGIVQATLDKRGYENGELILASDNAPSSRVVKEIFAENSLPTQKDDSFDYPQAKNVKASEQGDTVTISFESNANLNYRVIKKALLKEDEVIADIKNQEGLITLSDVPDGLFGYNRYVIIPYYYNDDNVEIIGEIVHIPVS